MSKFRSKLKRHTKGAKWARGQSATSNPQNKKHRNAARSRFFQPNLHTGMHFFCIFALNRFLNPISKFSNIQMQNHQQQMA